MRRNSSWLRLPALIACGVLVVAGSASAQTSEPAKQARETTRQAGNAITDSWITMKVHAQFVPEEALEGSDIDVETRNGVVTLAGTVLTEAGRARAVAIAKATDGVKSVTSNLKIGPAEARDAGARAGAEAREATGTTGRAMTDGWIKSKIYAEFLGEDALEDSDIDVDVTRGAVVLNGTVRNDAGKTRAEALAKSIEGVRTVKNNLKVGKDG